MAKKTRRGLSKQLKPDELLKLSDGTSEIYIVPARRGCWQVVAPPQFKITAEKTPERKGAEL